MDYNRVTDKKGGDHTEDIVQNLKDAGCDEGTIADICRLYDTGQVCDAVRALRRHRVILMEQLHESQYQVDCLDFLVRKWKKEDDKQKSMDSKCRKDGNVKMEENMKLELTNEWDKTFPKSEKVNHRKVTTKN